VGVDADAEYDDATQDSDIALRNITDFTNFTDDYIEKIVVDGTNRIADNCTQMLQNKKRGMISESNKLLTRIGLLKRDLLLFVRRVRRHRRIVIFRKQLDWLNKMCVASIDEITKYWNIDITDHE
jgi:predicted P-loop ATPase/GTPase